MMKKYRTRILSILLTVCLTVSISVPAFAAEITTDPQEYTMTTAVSRGPIILPVSFDAGDIALYDQFAAMSTAELTAYLNALSPTNPSSYNITPASDAINYQLAAQGFIAIAALLVKLSKPCAAELVLHALADEDYTETNGIFSDKIVTTQMFLSWIPTATSTEENKIFTETDNSDLYYALREVTLSVPYTSAQGKVVHCYDVFDFDGHERFETLMATLLNEGAWILTCNDILYRIDVNISFIY